MKTFKELQIGDYIYHTSGDYDSFWQVFRIIKIDICKEETQEYPWGHIGDARFEVLIFGEAGMQMNKIYLFVPQKDIDSDTTKFDYSGIAEKDIITTHINCPSTGVGLYIYNKAKDVEHKEYELIQENLLSKEKTPYPFYVKNPNDHFIGQVEMRRWNRYANKVLYKAKYKDCPDGPFFVRDAEDFYNNFTRIG